MPAEHWENQDFPRTDRGDEWVVSFIELIWDYLKVEGLLFFESIKLNSNGFEFFISNVPEVDFDCFEIISHNMLSFDKENKVIFPEFDLFTFWFSLKEVVIGGEDFVDFFGFGVVIEFPDRLLVRNIAPIGGFEICSVLF